ncbi:MAG: alkaline phosphatase D family protein [Opitutaceae bacterium]|nr:alkaline phosphatase D family protein [Opitutaceae bacterium]
MKRLLAALLLSPSLAIAAHQATGIKLVEPTADRVTVWTRITRDAQRAPDEGPLPILRVVHRQTGAVQPIRDNAAYPQGRPEVSFPPGASLATIRGAAIGARGQTRVRHRAAGTRDWITSPWRDVDPARDFTAVFALSGLAAATRHEVEVEARPAAGAAVTSTVAGGFTTAPAPGAAARVVFSVMSCQKYEMRDHADGFAIYPSMLALRPDFMVNTGDVLYYDHGPVHALNHDLARYHWARMFSFPTLRDFHRQVGSYFMKDDHDILANDCEPGSRTGDFTFEDGLRVFHEQTAQPMPPYRTLRWGRHLQVWIVEGRDFRTARSKDGRQAATIWGAPQITWLQQSLAASDATFRVLITSTPIVGPDRPQKDDNYSNPGFAEEGAQIRAMLGAHRNLTVITGDRHWQYVSTDKATGLEEWSVGAATDKHAGGWNEEAPRPEHRFLRIKHGGFLSGEVTPAAPGSAASLTLRLHDTAGKTIFESSRP